MKRTGTISSEYVPAGEGCPPWLFDAYCQPLNQAPLLTLHPTELHRQQTLERLHDAEKRSRPNIISPSTASSVCSMWTCVYPCCLDDEAATFMALHEKCTMLAEDAGLPFLYT